MQYITHTFFSKYHVCSHLRPKTNEYAYIFFPFVKIAISFDLFTHLKVILCVSTYLAFIHRSSFLAIFFVTSYIHCFLIFLHIKCILNSYAKLKYLPKDQLSLCEFGLQI